MAVLVPSCVWWVTPAVVAALDERFGDPVDAYVNGSQTWLRDDGPGDIAIEWRLHPVPGYRRPDGISHHEIFPTVALGVHGTADAPDPATLWDGLEAFPAYGDEVEPATLATAVTEALGIAPDAVGLVDHDAVADAWERSGGDQSVTEALLSQLTPS